MNKRRLAAIAAAAVSVSTAVSGIAVYAKANDAAMKNASLENDYIRLTVEQDSDQSEYLRFCLDTNNGQTSTKDDDQKNLTYKNFYSGYTTLNINGENYIYGEGTDTREPAYDASTGSHTSSQKFGDVEIQQTCKRILCSSISTTCTQICIWQHSPVIANHQQILCKVTS